MLFLSADEPSNTLEILLDSLGVDSGIINARKNYKTALVEQQYRYLQWWKPSLILNNDLTYPYEHDTFDDLAASNTTSLVFSSPLPTGTILDMTVGYGLNRDMIVPETWGFAQDLQGKIGIGQSLNPWWIHTRKNPYTTGAALQTGIAQNDYNSSVKAALLSCIRNYIALRKVERNRNMLNERIALYDDMMIAYRHMQVNGGISWRELQNVRKDKWEDEQTFFSLEQDINTLKGELYQLTGIQADNISDEHLIALDSPIWTTIFLNTRKEDIHRLEETTIQFQKERLRIDRLISRQSNAPLIKFEFGTSFKLPVQETDSLRDAWKKENFDDNILNNWSFTVSVDVSSLFSPLNKKNNLTYQLSQNALDELLQSIYTGKKKEIIQNTAIIQQLEDHLARLRVIIQDEEKNMQDDKLMFDRGALTELEYRQSLLEYQSKGMLLEDFSDDLWLYRFLASFYL
jgi:hypothetical protein